MPQAVKSTTLEEPTLAEVNHITFSGDLMDVTKTVVSVSLTVVDNVGGDFEDIGVLVEDIPGLQGIITAFQNSVLPKIVDKVEADLGVTFV